MLNEDLSLDFFNMKVIRDWDAEALFILRVSSVRRCDLKIACVPSASHMPLHYFISSPHGLSASRASLKGYKPFTSETPCGVPTAHLILEFLIQLLYDFILMDQELMDPEGLCFRERTH